MSPDMNGRKRYYNLGREQIKGKHKVTIFASRFDYNTKKYIKVHLRNKRYLALSYNLYGQIKPASSHYLSLTIIRKISLSCSS